MYQIRHAVETDYAAIAEIATLTRPEPSTAEEILRQDRQQLEDPEQVFHRLVAVDGNGRLVGYGFAERANWEPEGRWSVRSCTHPDWTGRGVGIAILIEAERIAREAGATDLFSWTEGDNETALAWAKRRGYIVDRQRTESILDLATFDASRFAGAVDRVRESGLRLELLSERSEYPDELLHSIYELDRICSPDVPAWDAGDTFPTYENYRKDWLAYPHPFTCALALDGDRVVGMSSIYYPPPKGKSGLVGWTAVLREYRGRGIALAVKLMATEDAIRRGSPRLRTNNDPDNPPMLAINVKMGFQFIPGPYRLVKRI